MCDGCNDQSPMWAVLLARCCWFGSSFASVENLKLVSKGRRITCACSHARLQARFKRVCPCAFPRAT
eukprot:scaffold1390_cov138-Cylindrotheca_fusiformis.AAC.43